MCNQGSVVASDVDQTTTVITRLWGDRTRHPAVDHLYHTDWAVISFNGTIDNK